MKISLNWLNDYIDAGQDAGRIAEMLSDLGLPCEGIEYLDNDTVIDVEVTSNRGDCLGHIGIARELAAVTGNELKIPEVKLSELAKEAAEFAAVEITEPDLCGRYTGRIIEGAKVGPSPDWLKDRLEAIGFRSVNNVVDATNYALAETSQPPHAFDYEKIAQGKIIVRKALKGEILISIDGSKCELDNDMLVIADTERAVAIAGVMGGADTEVSEKTTTILLEDAYFDPVSVRRTSRRLALPSEAAFRFERKVDIEAIDWASRRTAQLITQVAGGKVAKGVLDVYPKKPTLKKLVLRLGRLNKLLGIEIPSEETIKILSRLGFNPRPEGDSLVCVVPSWRSDVYREIDLIEEVARIYGYNKIPTEKKIRIEVAPPDARQKFLGSVGTYLNGCGFYETINVTFIDGSVAELFVAKDADGHLAVKDKSRKGANLLRQTLLGSLFGVLKTNLNSKNTPCRVFEIADTFVPSDRVGTLPVQKTKLALVCDSELRYLRGVIDGLVKNLDKDAEMVFSPSEVVWAEIGAEIVVNGTTIGVAGVVSGAVREKMDFGDIAPCGAEIDFESLLVLKSTEVKFEPIPRFPAIVRDLSVIVDNGISWSQIAEAVNRKAPEELEEVKFIGIYRDNSIGADKKSVTLSLRFRDEEGTLTHDTVDRFEADIVAELTKSTGAELRTA